MEISPDGEDYYDPADPPCVGLCYINKLKKLEGEKKANERSKRGSITFDRPIEERKGQMVRNSILRVLLVDQLRENFMSAFFLAPKLTKCG